MSKASPIFDDDRLGRRRSKYGAVKTVVDGITFASAKEARRYSALKLLERAGEIELLTRQPRFPLVVNGQLVCTYVGDFAYHLKDGTRIVEDVKGFQTEEFKLKRKLVRACYGFEIVLS